MAGSGDGSDTSGGSGGNGGPVMVLWGDGSEKQRGEEASVMHHN